MCCVCARLLVWIMCDHAWHSVSVRGRESCPRDTNGDTECLCVFGSLRDIRCVYPGVAPVCEFSTGSILV